MDNKEQEQEQDILNLKSDKSKTIHDYKFLVQKLKSMQEIINLLENNFLHKEM